MQEEKIRCSKCYTCELFSTAEFINVTERAQLNLVVLVNDPISICRKRVGVTAGGMVIQKVLRMLV